MAKTIKNLSALDTEISQIWRWRAYQNFADSEPIFYQLWQDMGFEVSELPTWPQIKTATESFGAPRVAAILLFQASLDRRQLKWQRWSQLIQCSEKLLLGHMPFFYLSVEKNCRAMMLSLHAEAVEHGLDAISCAPHFSQQVSIKLNTLLAMENLGVNPRDLPTELEQELQQLSLESTGPGLQSIQSELIAYHKRANFRSGRFDLLFANHAQTEGAFLEEDDLKLLASQLPYHEFYKPVLDLSRFLRDNNYCSGKNYKLHTLKGIREPKNDDASVPTLSAWCDRIYIWTWRWLVDPKQLPVNLILEELLTRDLWNLNSKLTDTNVHMLRLSLSWLSLFDWSSHLQINRLLKRLRVPVTNEFILFDAEAKLIECLQAALQNQKEEFYEKRRVALQHPVFQNSKMLFESLLSFDTDLENSHPLILLKSELNAVVNSDADMSFDVHVNIRRSLISILKSDRKLQSLVACKALEILYLKQTISCEDFARHCFDLAVYDPWTHQRRISSLLSRLQGLLGPNFQFHIRQGQIIATAPWSTVKISGRDSIYCSLAHEPLWIELLKKTDIHSKSLSSPIETSPPTWLGEKNWREIHQLIKGTSRSSTLRHLQNWVHQGLIEKQGRGKMTTYLHSSQHSSQ